LTINHATPVCTASAACDYTACSPGWADLDGNRLNGCETMTPLGTPEAAKGQLLLWLKADTGYANGTWLDQSGKHADGTCSSCPAVFVDSKNNSALYFDGSSNQITLSDPNGQYDSSFNPTIFVVATSLGVSALNASLIRFADASGTNTVSLRRDTGNTTSMDFAETTASTSPSLAQGLAWDGDQEIVVGTIDVTGLGDFWYYTQGAQSGGIVGQMGVPPTATRSASVIGSNGAGGYLAGYVYQVVVYKGAMSQTSLTAVQNYLNTYYGGI
jgi:hypothetical protein